MYESALQKVYAYTFFALILDTKPLNIGFLKTFYRIVIVIA